MSAMLMDFRFQLIRICVILRRQAGDTVSVASILIPGAAADTAACKASTSWTMASGADFAIVAPVCTGLSGRHPCDTGMYNHSGSLGASGGCATFSSSMSQLQQIWHPDSRHLPCLQGLHIYDCILMTACRSAAGDAGRCPFWQHSCGSQHRQCCALAHLAWLTSPMLMLQASELG